MEYCDSGDLSQLIKKPIKEKYVQYYFNQLNEGIKYLRNNNIFHRDIKPKNILLKNNYKILKIADFGLSREITSNTMIETVCGSPLYMAPEIMNKKAYNNQTDLWSIGLILYEMLYGIHPYKNCKNITSLMFEIEKNDISIPPLESKDIKISNQCMDLLKNLLKKDVKKRIDWLEFCNNIWINKSNENLMNKNNKIKQNNKINIIENHYSSSIIENSNSK